MKTPLPTDTGGDRLTGRNPAPTTFYGQTDRSEPGRVASDFQPHLAAADLVEAAELLDIDVDHVAGMLSLVATHRLGRFQIAHPVQSQKIEVI